MKLAALFIAITLFPSLLVARDYSLFYEEDATTVMIIYYDNNYKGEIIVYGGYEWFKKVYNNNSSLLETYVQPAHYGISGNQKSWMLEQYKISSFKHTFRFDSDDEILQFQSKESFQTIVGHLARNEGFSLASLNPGTARYAGTFIPILKKNSLIDLASENQMTFCMLLNETDNINGKNVELNSSNIRELMKREKYECDSRNLLKKSSKPVGGV